jgi:hypothetical protein
VYQGRIHVVDRDAGLRFVIKTVVKQDLGNIGRNGRRNDASAMLNMLPKFELVPITMYLMMLAKQRRPSITPFRTARSFSSRMIFAASFATSTPFMTEIPTSAVCSEGVSLMPSPTLPNDVPARLQSEDDPVLLLRRHAGNDGLFFAW